MNDERTSKFNHFGIMGGKIEKSYLQQIPNIQQSNYMKDPQMPNNINPGANINFPIQKDSFNYNSESQPNSGMNIPPLINQVPLSQSIHGEFSNYPGLEGESYTKSEIVPDPSYLPAQNQNNMNLQKGNAQKISYQNIPGQLGSGNIPQPLIPQNPNYNYNINFNNNQKIPGIPLQYPPETINSISTKSSGPSTEDPIFRAQMQNNNPYNIQGNPALYSNANKIEANQQNVSINFVDSLSRINNQNSSEVKLDNLGEGSNFQMPENNQKIPVSNMQNPSINKNINESLVNPSNESSGSGTIKLNRYPPRNKPPASNIQENPTNNSTTTKYSAVTKIGAPIMHSSFKNENQLPNILLCFLSTSKDNHELEESKSLIDNFKDLSISENNKSLINIEKFPCFFKIPVLFANKSSKDILPLIISAVYFSYMMCMQSGQSLGKDIQNFFLPFLQRSTSIGVADSDLLPIVNQNGFKISNYNYFFSKYESKIITFHSLRLKYLLNNQSDINEIIQHVLNEMENTYKIPIEFIVKSSDSTLKFKKGNFSNSLKAKIIVHYSVNPISMYIFQQNPSYSNFSNSNKEIDLGKNNIDNLNLFFLECIKTNSDPKLMIEKHELFKKLKDYNFNKDQIIDYLKNYIAELIVQQKEVQNEKLKINTEGKPIVYEKKCSECGKDNIFIYFPCENNKNVIRACIFCRKEYLLNVIQNSREHSQCTLCNQPYHENESKAICSFLKENITTEQTISKVEEKNCPINNSNNSSKIVEEPPSEKPFEDDKNIYTEKVINRKSKNIEETNPNSHPKSNIRRGNEIHNENQNVCAFCEKPGIIDLDILANENCNPDNKELCHFFHENCLIKFAKEISNNNGKLEDVKCPKCNSKFDYFVIASADPALADKLTGSPSPTPLPSTGKGKANEKDQKVENAKRLEYEACMFCKSNDKRKLINQENCMRKNFQHLYHEECLVQYGWKVANEGKKLDNIVCPYCKAEFDHYTFSQLDQELADELNIYKPSKKQKPKKEDKKNINKPVENPNKNQIIVEQPVQNIPEVKINSVCDMKHVHAAGGDRTELSSTLCSHRYIKACLSEYLYANMQEFKNIDEIKCPVEGCNQFFIRQMVQLFPQFIDKFDDIVTERMHKKK